MNHKLEIKPRKRLRLPTYNYCSNGYYFITVCTSNRQCLFGNICENIMYLNAAGKMIYSTIASIQNEYLGWFLDTQIVMPNHIHAILRLYKYSVNQPKSLSLPELIHNIKSLTTACYIKGVYLHKTQPGQMARRQL